MNRKQLRAIANSQPDNPRLGERSPLRVRIGNRNKFTGYYEVILPNGAVLKNGVKLFKSSVPYGTEVEGKLSPNGQLFYLDYLDYEPQIVEIKVEDEEIEIPTEVLILCIDITKSIGVKGIVKALAFLDEFLQENPLDVGFVTFGDDICQIFEPTTATDVIDFLQDKVDNFTGLYDDEFWCDEGTDLPENGVDAIAEALKIEDVAVIYLITDNQKFSNNENSVDEVVIELEKKEAILYLDIDEQNHNYVVDNPSNYDFQIYNNSAEFKSVYVATNNNLISNLFSYNPQITQFKIETGRLKYLFDPVTNLVQIGSVGYIEGVMTADIVESFNSFSGTWNYIGYVNGFGVFGMTSVVRLEIRDRIESRLITLRTSPFFVRASLLVNNTYDENDNLITANPNINDFQIIYVPQVFSYPEPPNDLYQNHFNPSPKIIFVDN